MSELLGQVPNEFPTSTMPLCSLFTQQPDKLLKMLSQDMKPYSKPPIAPHWHLKHTLLTPVFEAPHDLEPRTLPGLITLFRLINWSFAALWTASLSPASTWNALSPDIHMAGSFFLHWDWRAFFCLNIISLKRTLLNTSLKEISLIAVTFSPLTLFYFSS